MKSEKRYILAIILLLILLPLFLMAAVTFGTVDLSLRDVYGAVFSRQTASETAVWDVVWLIRLPRLVLAMAVGMGLSVCGIVMQAIVKNPLADPYILGVSSGASLGATAALMIGAGAFFGQNFMGVMGFIGALAASLAVLSLANLGGRSNSVKLLLAGTAVSAVCSAFSNFIIFISDKKEAVSVVVHWTMGSLAGADWQSNAVIAGVILAGSLFFWSQYRTLNLMLLGDASAITLGTDLHRRRLVYLIVSALMVGFAVYKAV